MLLIAEQTDIHEVSGIDHRSMGGNASIFYLSGKHWLDVTNQNFWQDFLIIAFLIQLAEAMIVTCSIDDENLIPELIHKLCQTHGKFFVAGWLGEVLSDRFLDNCQGGIHAHNSQ